MRVSTEGQRFDRQKIQLNEYGCDRIFAETASGANTKRTELNKLLEMLREGDTVVVVKLSRLGRTLKHLIELINDFQSRGIHFVSITEGFNTETAAGRLIFNIMGAMAEFEKDLTSERTRKGLEAAKQRGARIGRPKGMSKKSQLKAIELYALHKRKIELDLTVDEIRQRLSIGSSSTYYKYLEWAEENAK